MIAAEASQDVLQVGPHDIGIRTADGHAAWKSLIHTPMCVYVCMHVCMYACMYACMYVRMCIYMSVCVHVCLSRYVCMYVCIYLYMHLFMYASVYVCILVVQTKSEQFPANCSECPGYYVGP